MNGSDDGKRAATTEAAGGGAARQGIPAGVWVLGFVSMLMDISSEMIHALLPLYMVTVLGTSTLAVGIIEGIAEATASITKVFSGSLSDWLGKRKALAALGYGLAAFTKPVFALAASLEWLIAARFIDRVGKGIARRAARCPRRRYRATASARREFWFAPVARHARRLSGSASRHRPDVADAG
jgi:MFS family permease